MGLSDKSFSLRIMGSPWGRTYSRVQNASLVPAFQNSDLQANASVEIIVMPARVGPVFHTASPNCKDWQYDWHYDDGNYS